MILHRYLVREVLLAFAAVLVILMLVFIAGRFADFLATAAAGRIGRGFIFELLALRCVDALTTLLPAGLFAALVLGLGRLGRDHEIVAMTAGGLSRARIAGTVLSIGAGFSVAAGVLSVIVAPAANERYESLLARARGSVETSQILQERFTRFGHSDRVFYVQRISGDLGALEHVFTHSASGGTDEVIFAPSAHYLSNPEGRFLVLENGHHYVGTPGQGQWSTTRFGRYTVRVQEDEADAAATGVESMSTPRLWAASRTGLAAAAELQWRLSQPVLAVVLAGIAFPLALAGAARGPFERLLSGIASYLAYLGLVISAVKAIESGDLAPGIGVWPVHGVFAAIAILFCLRAPGAARSGRRRRNRNHDAH